jgi:hypothetical protein
MAKKSSIDLYELLPATYRIDDAQQGYALKALMGLMSEQANLLKDDISGLYDDLFIETCADWVIPYIGDLVANNPIYETIRGRRADVAKTIYYRRRKGTLPMLEELARDITGWSAHAVAFFEQLGWTQNLNHIRYAGAPNPQALDPNAADRVGTAHIRNLNAMDLLDGPFDITSHTVDVRRIRRTEGWYNIKKIGFFLWRLASYRMELSNPRQSAVSYGWHFSPLGNPIPLFTKPEQQLGATGQSTEIDVRAPIRPLAFHDDLAATRGLSPQPLTSQYFGKDRSVAIFVNSPDAFRPLDATCLDLSAWERPPAAFSGVFSGALAAINIGAAAPEINVTIGGEGTHKAAPLPSGSPTLIAAAAGLETAIRHAAATRGFTGARVIPVGNQLLVIPGVRGATVSFSTTAGDSTTVKDLKLDAGSTSIASGVMSGDLSDFPKSFNIPTQLEVTMGAHPPQTIVLAAAPLNIADAATKIATALNAVAFPEFAGAQVLLAGSRLLILPGVEGALVRVRATVADPTTAELLKLTNKVGVDVRLGRFAFPIGDEPGIGAKVQVDYNYGFSGDGISSDLGGGPYDRRDRTQRLGQALLERPDTVRFPDALRQTIRVVEVVVNPATEATTISGAILLWNALADKHAVIQVEDNRTYIEDIAITVPGGELVLQAMNQFRPTLIGSIDITASGGAGRFQLNGFWVAGKLAIHGSLGELKVMHSTLVPGLTLDESGAPVSPDSPSLVVDAGNNRLHAIIGNSITGSLQIPDTVVSLEIRNSIIDTSRREGRATQVPALVSGVFTPFFVPPAPPKLRVTIGDEGPLTVQLSGIPLTDTDARTELESAIRAASTSPGFANAHVLLRNGQFFVLSGNGGRISIQDAPGDATAAKWKLALPDARESFGLLSGSLTAPITLTGATPAVDLIMGSIGPVKVDLTGIPAALAAAQGFLENAIRLAHAGIEFTATEVFLLGNQFLILPGGDPGSTGVAASFVFRKSDLLPLLELQLESARPSIAGSIGGESEAPNTILENVTIFGASIFRELTLASNVIFQQVAYAVRRQAGCVRFSYITPGSRLPRRYRCQPDLALEGVTDAATKSIVKNRLRPTYTSIHYGDPGYAQLGLGCACEIKMGAENGSEMGAFNLLLQPQREANLKIRLDEYLPFGLEPGLIYIT